MMGRLVLVAVLVADDQELIRRLVSSELLARGFDVCHAVDGAEAVQIAQEKRPALVVLDLAMPEMNGLEAARVLKSKMPHIPLLMFTNTVGPLLSGRPNRLGSEPYFRKVRPSLCW